MPCGSARHKTRQGRPTWPGDQNRLAWSSILCEGLDRRGHHQQQQQQQPHSRPPGPHHRPSPSAGRPKLVLQRRLATGIVTIPAPPFVRRKEGERVRERIVREKSIVAPESRRPGRDRRAVTIKWFCKSFVLSLSLFFFKAASRIRLGYRCILAVIAPTAPSASQDAERRETNRLGKKWLFANFTAWFLILNGFPGESFSSSTETVRRLTYSLTESFKL